MNQVKEKALRQKGFSNNSNVAHFKANAQPNEALVRGFRTVRRLYEI